MFSGFDRPLACRCALGLSFHSLMSFSALVFIRAIAGPAASCLFQRRGPVDLSHHALYSRDGRRANKGDRIVAGGWRVLRAYFPGSIDTHCLVQDFFFGEDLLLRRHDYSVNIAGGFGAAQLTSDYAEANGIRLPTKRRAYTRGPDRRPILVMLMVSIDISDVSLT
jgi:hypothetical protein